MSKAHTYASHRPGPSDVEERQARELRRSVERGDLKPPAVRLQEQLEAIVRKWDRLFGADFGAKSDEEFCDACRKRQDEG